MEWGGGHGSADDGTEGDRQAGDVAVATGAGRANHREIAGCAVVPTQYVRCVR